METNNRKNSYLEFEKFKVGDWIIDNKLGNKIMVINAFDDSGYGFELIDIYGNRHNNSVLYIEENYHHWSLNDAKDGDVLNANGAVFVYKKHDNNYLYFHYGINLSGEFVQSDEEDEIWSTTRYVVPATKEQRDLLFEKMFENNEENKTNISVYEQKYNEALEKARQSIKDGTISNNTIAYLESIFPELKETEDERMSKVLIDFVKCFTKGYDIIAANGPKVSEVVSWIEKLPKRLVPKEEKEEWKPSKGQLKALENIIHEEDYDDFALDTLLNDLKLLMEE